MGPQRWFKANTFVVPSQQSSFSPLWTTITCCVCRWLNNFMICIFRTPAPSSEIWYYLSGTKQVEASVCGGPLVAYLTNSSFASFLLPKLILWPMSKFIKLYSLVSVWHDWGLSFHFVWPPKNYPRQCQSCLCLWSPYWEIKVYDFMQQFAPPTIVVSCQLKLDFAGSAQFDTGHDRGGWVQSSEVTKTNCSCW